MHAERPERRGASEAAALPSQVGFDDRKCSEGIVTEDISPITSVGIAVVFEVQSGRNAWQYNWSYSVEQVSLSLADARRGAEAARDVWPTRGTHYSIVETAAVAFFAGPAAIVLGECSARGGLKAVRLPSPAPQTLFLLEQCLRPTHGDIIIRAESAQVMLHQGPEWFRYESRSSGGRSPLRWIRKPCSVDVSDASALVACYEDQVGSA